MDKKDDKPKIESKSIVADISSQLAALMLKEAHERGEVIKIQKVEVVEIAPTASPVAFW